VGSVAPAAEQPAQSTNVPVVLGRGVAFQYNKGKTALHPTDVSIYGGTVVGFIGPNGAGKSTLLKLLATALRPSGGHLEVFGVSGNPAQVRKQLGYLPDEAALFDELTGVEQLQLIAAIRRSDEPVLTLLAELGLNADDAHARISTYSFGMRRKVALAQALIGKPRLLVLDEPTIGLDASARQQAGVALRSRAEQGAAAVLSSNDLAFVEQFCDQVVLLHEGRIVLQGSPAELLQDLRQTLAYRVEMEDTLVEPQLPEGILYTAVDSRTGVFRAATGVSLTELVGALDRAGNRIHALEERRADLSDVFQAATGLTWAPQKEVQ
jgi:ABC-type multidrug transport system ATPase subunit